MTDEQRVLAKTSEYEKHFFDSASDDLQVASLVCFHEEEKASRSLLSPLLDHQRNIVPLISNAFSFLAISTSILQKKALTLEGKLNAF